jgi:hypothetical protein
MSAELDVSWFDLKKYDGFVKLDLNGWYVQLCTRSTLFESIHKENNFLPIMRGLQKNPIHKTTYECDGFHKEFSFNTVSVYSTPTFYVWLDRELNEVPIDIERDASIPYDFLIRQNGIEMDDANVIVDLNATDEQILSDFKHWLTEYRNATGHKSNKNNFSDKDLAYWHESRLLPYIDLTLSAAIEGKKIMQTKIASLVFKDYQDIDVVDKLRRTTKPKAEWLLSDETLAAIDVQLNSSKGRNKKLA